MAPKMPEDYRAARRAQIIGAAAECFLEKGFHSTTMQDIFEKSGLSAGAVYNYFKGKDEIVAAMNEMSRARNASLISLVPEATDEAPLLAVLRSFLEMLKTPEAGRWAPLDLSLYAESSRNEVIREGIEANFRTNVGALVPLVEDAQARGECPSGVDPHSLILALSMLIQGLQILRVVDPDMDVNAYADACMAIAGCTFGGSRDVRGKAEEADA